MGFVFFRELIQVTAADILLLTLVTFFFLAGLGYKLKSTRDIWRMRTSIRKKREAVLQSAEDERKLKIILHELLQAQNKNMEDISRLKQQKIDLSLLPDKLEKELDDLITWSEIRNISVDEEKCMASRMPVRRQKPS